MVQSCHVDLADWVEAGPDTNDTFLVKRFRRNDDLAVRPKQDGWRQARLDKFQRYQTIVDGTKLRSTKFDEINLNSPPFEVVE